MKAKEIAQEAVRKFDVAGAPWNLELADEAVSLALADAVKACERVEQEARLASDCTSMAACRDCAAAIRAMMAERGESGMKPEDLVQCWPVGQFIQEELDARGWSAQGLALRMGGDIAIDTLAVELVLACSDDPNMLVDADSDARMARAFGVTPGMFCNLQRTYRQWKLAQGGAQPLMSEGRPA